MTLEMAVAPIALALANHPRLEEYDLSSLRYIMWGATPVTESVARMVTERTGVRWLPAYGASEVPVIAANPVERPEAWRLDSAGLPPAGVELRIADLDTGAILPSGEIGEIQVLSPSVMAGYLPERRHRRRLRRRLVPHRRRRMARAGGLGPSHRSVEGDDQGQRLPGGARRGGGRAARAPGRARLRGLRRARRAGRRGAGGRRAIRSGRAGGATASSRAWWPNRWPPTSACTTWSWWTTSRGCPRARCCDASCGTNGWRPTPAPGRRA